MFRLQWMVPILAHFCSAHSGFIPVFVAQSTVSFTKNLYDSTSHCSQYAHSGFIPVFVAQSTV